MDICTSDGNRQLDLGDSGDFRSLRSTVLIRLDTIKPQIPLALRFLETLHCPAWEAIETARQINLIRDGLAQVAPADAVYDPGNPSIPAPWAQTVSPVVTSCANLYLTPDGKDLLFELVSILTYAGIADASVRTA